MTNKHEQLDLNLKEGEPMIKIVSSNAQVDRDGFGGCHLVLKIDDKKEKVNASLQSNGEIRILNQDRFDDRTLAGIRVILNEKFAEAKNNRVEEDALTRYKTVKGVPKCKNCGGYHWRQEPCGDSAL